MFWTVYCIDKPNTAAAREEHMQVHRDYVDSMMHGVFFAGPLQTDDASASLGTLFILNMNGREEAERFIEDEPFNRAGIFEKVAIHRMSKRRHNAQLADVP